MIDAVEWVSMRKVVSSRSNLYTLYPALIPMNLTLREVWAENRNKE